MTLEVRRDAKPTQLTVTIAELKPTEAPAPKPAAAAPAQPGGIVGLRLSTLTQSLRQRLSLPAQVQGVLVTGVAEGSAAAELGLEPGDVIEQVNGRKVGAPMDITGALTSAGKSGRKSVALLVNRQGQKEFVALPVTNG
jgi:serine protease Do